MAIIKNGFICALGFHPGKGALKRYRCSFMSLLCPVVVCRKLILQAFCSKCAYFKLGLLCTLDFYPGNGNILLIPGAYLMEIKTLGLLYNVWVLLSEDSFML